MQQSLLGRSLAEHSPLLLLENLQMVREIIKRENCLSFLVRLGHDCCGFFRGMAAIWRQSRVRGEGEIVVVLESNALQKNCLDCVDEVNRAENLLNVRIIKKGRALRRFQETTFAGKTLEVHKKTMAILLQFIILKSVFGQRKVKAL